MNQHTPADPPPVVGTRSARTTFAPSNYISTAEPADTLASDRPSTQPEKSFSRGVAVGIAIMIPVWTWLLIRLLH